MKSSAIKKLLNVNFLELPFYKINDVWDLEEIKKNISCIYFVISQAHGLLYIGRAKDLRARYFWHFPLFPESHKMILPMIFLQDCKISYLEMNHELLEEAEKILIYHYSPHFNDRDVDKNHINQQSYEAFKDLGELYRILYDYQCMNIYEAQIIIDGRFEYWPHYLQIIKDRKKISVNMI